MGKKVTPEKFPIQFHCRSKDDTQWYGLAFEEDETIRFELTCSTIDHRIDVTNIFPDRSDIIGFTGPDHIIFLKNILLTFTPFFGGISAGKPLPLKVKGICHHLLKSTSAFIVGDNSIISVVFSADVVLDLTGQKLHKWSEDNSSVARSPNVTRTLPTQGGIRLELTFGCSASYDRFGPTQFTDYCSARLDFDLPQPIDEAIITVARTRMLFAFLAGYAFPKTTVTLECANGTSATANLSATGKGSKPKNRSFSLWTEQPGSLRLEEVWKNYSDKLERLTSAIGATVFSIHSSRNIDQRILATLPTLEQLISEDFKTEEEVTYLEREEKFWQYIEAEEDLLDFARKHIEVRNRKVPSFGTKIQRLANLLNVQGAKFSPDTGRMIAKIRNARFHTPGAGANAENYYEAQRTATALLGMYVFLLLGITPAMLKNSPILLPEFREFVA